MVNAWGSIVRAVDRSTCVEATFFCSVRGQAAGGIGHFGAGALSGCWLRPAGAGAEGCKVRAQNIGVGETGVLRSVEARSNRRAGASESDGITRREGDQG